MTGTSYRAAVRFAAAIAACMATTCTTTIAAEHAATPTRLPNIDVIGTTPLPGVGLAREQIAAPVQSATGEDIDRSNAPGLTDFLNRNLGSVYINEIQGNAFQPDVNYRGYTASPLLGTPQGLSVYMDGVRLNQPFGDVVSWDLIPRSAIASINLMPGSNPLFGLNTLGGALSIQTKDGRSHPGSSLLTTFGSNSRRSAEISHGGSATNGLDWFVTANLYRDNGWRDDSPSRIGQFFGKLGWHGGATDLKFTYAFADNTLKGNGLQEQKFLVRDYVSVYTRPDITDNRSHFLNLAATRGIGDSLLLSGNTYYRRITTDTLNADINEGSLNQDVYGAGETAANTPFPFTRCIATVLLAAADPAQEPGGICNALINRTRTSQNNYGVSGQATWLGTLAGHRNQFTAGGGVDESRIKFSQSSQIGYLNPDRTVSGLNAFADGGLTGGSLNGDAFDNRVNLDGRVRTWSAYGTNTTSFRGAWHLTLSGRYNRTNIRNTDNINPGGGATSLDGDHTFNRFNPAIGVTFNPSTALTAYAGYNEGSRAPTSIELGCANPAQPCRLPNAMAGDPPLNQVVTKTWEAGLHGALGEHLHWNAGVFRAENEDDILFVAAPNQTFGFFRNFGKTRRQGVELGLRGERGRFSFSGNYSLIDATFQSPETLNATNNSSNDAVLRGDAENGNIQVRPGDRIPLVPQHMFKLSSNYRVNADFSVNANMIAVGSSYARGNENNAHAPDGVLFLGPGKSGGYAVFNLGAQLQIEPALKLAGSIQNLFNRQYSTAAQLGTSGFDANGNFVARPFAPPAANNDVVRHATFFAPGAPRTFWISLRYTFDTPKQAK